MLGTWSIRAASLALACVSLSLSAPTRGAASPAVRPVPAAQPVHLREVSSAVVAEQLGVKLSPNQPDELAMGTSLTGTLVEPGRLAGFGISDAQAGARVSVLRSRSDRVRVDVDEMDPTPRTRTLALRMSAEGRLGTLAR